MSDRGEKVGFDWEGAEDITLLPEAELRERLEGLVEVEPAAGYRRRVPHRRIDLFRAELVRRGATTGSPEELVRVLKGDWRP